MGLKRLLEANFLLAASAQALPNVMSGAFADDKGEARRFPVGDRCLQASPERVVRLTDPSTGGKVHEFCPNFDKIAGVDVNHNIRHGSPLSHEEHCQKLH